MNQEGLKIVFHTKKILAFFVKKKSALDSVRLLVRGHLSIGHLSIRHLSITDIYPINLSDDEQDLSDTICLDG